MKLASSLQQGIQKSHPSSGKQITVVPFQERNEIELANAVDVANAAQDSYRFILDSHIIHINSSRYELENGAFDLDNAIDDLAKRRESFQKLLKQNPIFVTSLAYSDKNLVSEFRGKLLLDELSQCYFHEVYEYPQGNAALISTFVWDHLPPNKNVGLKSSPSGRRALQPYLLCEFAAIILDPLGDTFIHEETRGCPFDYCSNVREIDETFRVKRLCSEHEDYFRQQVVKGKLTTEQLDSAISLFNRAFGKVTKYDLFISHATEDKEDFVRPLAKALVAKGLRVWYDEFELHIGDSLRRKIDTGLAQSRFGLVVLSRSFFAKNWPQYELEGLVTREMAGEQVILPIWHQITKSEVMDYSPSLAGKLARSTSDFTVEEIAQEVANVIKNPR